MGFYTSEELYNKMDRIEKLLEKVMVREIRNNVQELSLTRAAKELHMGAETLKAEILAGRIKARKIRNVKSKDGYSYKLRVCDLYDYQNSGMYKPELVESQGMEFDPKNLAKKLMQRYMS